MNRIFSRDAGKVDAVERDLPNATWLTGYEPGRTTILLVLICFRLINAFCVRTFFQPDEYFQSLEPAWQMAFGRTSGAWITWEWQHQLRSSLHPAIFAALYLVSRKVIEISALPPQVRATVMVVMPTMLQGLFAAIGDYFTWKFAERIYGYGSNPAWIALVLTVLSPWQWFCSTRTLSNSLEMVLTVVALYFWPWGLAGPLHLRPLKPSMDQSASTLLGSHSDILRLRFCLIFAGIACILRPTNLLIWVSLVTITIVRVGLNGASFHSEDMLIFSREAILCGTLVISASSISDRLYFGTWTFPPYHWLNFNITKSLAVFYGTNDWHYYLSQGLPLLLTTCLPFSMQALWSSSSLSTPQFINNIRWDLTFVVLTMITTLSIISHKEVRFIYPLLPCLHLLAAPHVLSFFSTRSLQSIQRKPSGRVTIKPWRMPLLILLLGANIVIGLYATLVHQRGVIDVLTFLRHEYEAVHASGRGLFQGKWDSHSMFGLEYGESDPNEVFAAFLMPCHSTPWRSHLVYPGLRAWALTCEPPLHIPANTPERSSYRDEADRFYDDPDLFLRSEMNTTERRWPKYLVGFQGIESTIKGYYETQVPGWKVKERWSGFNSHWHDDNRRKGKVMVWEFVNSSQALSTNSL